MNIILTLVVFLFSAASIPFFAHAYYNQPEKKELIAPGVLATSPTAAKIRSANLIESVVRLYADFRPTQSNGPGVSYISDSDDCFTIFVSTTDGIKEYINQIRINRNDCL